MHRGWSDRLSHDDTGAASATSTPAARSTPPEQPTVLESQHDCAQVARLSSEPAIRAVWSQPVPLSLRAPRPPRPAPAPPPPPPLPAAPCSGAGSCRAGPRPGSSWARAGPRLCCRACVCACWWWWKGVLVRACACLCVLVRACACLCVLVRACVHAPRDGGRRGRSRPQLSVHQLPPERARPSERARRARVAAAERARVKAGRVRDLDRERPLQRRQPCDCLCVPHRRQRGQPAAGVPQHEAVARGAVGTDHLGLE
jgi:hypothetical protein